METGRDPLSPWDQVLARWIARPLGRTGVTPNQVTAFSLALALLAAALMASGRAAWLDLGAGLFVLARFLDHVDGELARLRRTSSPFGYYFDYVAGGLSYAAFYFGTGLGLADGWLGPWAVALGTAGAISALACLGLNLGIDRALGNHATGDPVGYPSAARLELEDGFYLVAPLTWAGLLDYFFAAAALGAAVYGLWTLGRFLACNARRGSDEVSGHDAPNRTADAERRHGDRRAA